MKHEQVCKECKNTNGEHKPGCSQLKALRAAIRVCKEAWESK